jgi:hypothetical protein
VVQDAKFYFPLVPYTHHPLHVSNLSLTKLLEDSQVHQFGRTKNAAPYHQYTFFSEFSRSAISFCELVTQAELQIHVAQKVHHASALQEHLQQAIRSGKPGPARLVWRLLFRQKHLARWMAQKRPMTRRLDGLRVRARAW